MKVTITKEVTYCLNCPHYAPEQGGLMACGHPSVKTMEQAYIISQDDVYKYKTFPKKCPLLKKP